MRAFVTGAGGQDAGYLVESLLEDGIEVHALAHAALGKPEVWPEAAALHLGDVTDVEATRDLLLAVAPDVVYNLAAISSVARSWAEPENTMRVNGHAAVALMESALAVQESTGQQVRFLQASSSEMYGEPVESPQDESTPLRPVNPYGEAKAFAHTRLPELRARGLHASGLILFNHESPRRPTKFVSRKITQGVAAIAHGRADRLTLGNLDARRDWGWAPDIVDALRRAAAADEPDDYVIATGVAHSVRDFVALAFHEAGIDDWEARVDIDPALTRPTDALTQVGDAGLARRRLGWASRVTFEEMVARMQRHDLQHD